MPYGTPLGIAYLASTLEKHGFYVKAIDMFDYSWDKVGQTLEEEQPDVVGITCLTEQRASQLEVAKLSKTVIIIFFMKLDETTAYFSSVHEFQNPHIN